MLSAAEVQAMIGAVDHEIIAHGYTYDRKSVDIFFEAGELVRAEEYFERGRGWKTIRNDKFNPEYFFDGIKRWYLGTPERGLNAKLAELFETFGRPLSTTPGGHY